MIKSCVHFIDILNSGVDTGVEDKRKKETTGNFSHRYVTMMANRTWMVALRMKMTDYVGGDTAGPGDT